MSETLAQWLMKKYVGWIQETGSVQTQGALFATDEGERLTYSGLRMIIQRLANKVKVPVPPLHSFRRLCALTMYRETRDLFAVQRYLGHTNPKTTMRYLRLTAEDTFREMTGSSPVERLI